MGHERKALIPQPRSKFLKIRCPDCGNILVTYSHASTKVKCPKCGKILVEPTGGKALIIAEILEVL
ncbi:30S ribosomal protein S27e [Thermofilum pendens]|uniref:Small ribosomal subunit protein eS27 n=1 Tax=Thermofilum pendens (strain DSM 2475 / Hrk 5) TaxID=368408 RepID=A1RXW5_THEPD|nr:30S ribosomal protein S27e [Thermofilum pendens]ABL78045.1 SSU ribosomal protein S27E [Thermofilum pendens Hrk 5]